jgi:hypothetical protein
MIKAQAESGDRDAQLELGWMYQRGDVGVPQSQEQAFAWWLKAAEKGQPYAQFNVAVAYERGQGVAQNYSEATNWYSRTSPPMDSLSLFNLGQLYFSGRGVVKDYEKATALWKEARQRGYTLAKNELGFIETITSRYPNGRVHSGNVVMKTNTPDGMTAYEGYQMPQNWLDFDTVTFTDKNGKKVVNAKVIEVTPVEIFYTGADGVCCDKAALEDLTPADQSRFGYNPKKAARIFSPDLREESENIRTVSGIVSDYYKNHTYIGKENGYAADVFVCGDMACEVWNIVQTKHITAKIAVGNVNDEIHSFSDVNHAWVLAETAPGEWLALETTGGRVVFSSENERYYNPWHRFKNPKEFRDTVDLMHQGQAAVQKLNDAKRRSNATIVAERVRDLEEINAKIERLLSEE